MFPTHLRSEGEHHEKQVEKVLRLQRYEKRVGTVLRMDRLQEMYFSMLGCN